MSERRDDPAEPLAPIGILAGSGTLPAEVARAIIASGGNVHVVRIDGDEDGALAGLPIEAFGWGQMGAIFASFRRAGCRELVFVGGVRRPDLTRIRPDLGLFWHLPGLLALVIAGGDDGLARTSIRFVETRGFRVASLADVAPGLLVPAGALGEASPDAGDMADILLGSSVVRTLGRHDIGQAVVIADGAIEAIEGAEGTDRMLERIAAVRARSAAQGGPAGRRGVLVKRPKPGQEMRIDMPAIGPRTVDRAEAAGLKGIAVLAGATLAAERPRLIRRAGEARLFVYGFTEGEMPRVTGPGVRGREAAGGRAVIETLDGAPLTAGWLAAITGTGPADIDMADIRRGAAALGSLAALGPAGSAVVVRGYVIGIEPTTDVSGLIERTREIRPWGVGRWRRRAGVAVVCDEAGLGEAAVRAAHGARLAALAMFTRPGQRPIPPAAATVEAARLSGVAIVRVRLGSGEGDPDV